MYGFVLTTTNVTVFQISTDLNHKLRIMYRSQRPENYC